MELRDSRLDHPGPTEHLVQFYSDPRLLADVVAHYLHAGFRQGDAALVIATPEHWHAFEAELFARGADPARAFAQRKLVVLDAAHTLSKIMVRGKPDWERVESTILRAIETLEIAPCRRIRTFGEMVGLLWEQGEYSAAIELEAHWNRLLRSVPASLLCAYPIDVFGREFQASSIHAILCDHTAVVAAHDTNRLKDAVCEGLREACGSGAAQCMTDMGRNSGLAEHAIPEAERMILWLRDRLPNAADQVLEFARTAYSQAKP